MASYGHLNLINSSQKKKKRNFASPKKKMGMRDHENVFFQNVLETSKRFEKLPEVWIVETSLAFSLRFFCDATPLSLGSHCTLVRNKRQRCRAIVFFSFQKISKRWIRPKCEDSLSFWKLLEHSGTSPKISIFCLRPHWQPMKNVRVFFFFFCWVDHVLMPITCR